MAKLSKNNEIEVVSEAFKVAIGAIVIAVLLYVADENFKILKTLNINQTDVKMIAASAVIFSFLWILMHKWFFMPYLKLFERRERLTVGAEDSLKDKDSEISEMLEQYEIKTIEARTTAMKAKMDTLSRAKQQAGEQIEKAKLVAQEELLKAKKEIAEKRMELQKNAEIQAQVLADQMVEQVLGTKGAMN